jgi:hypothetical protein
MLHDPWSTEGHFDRGTKKKKRIQPNMRLAAAHRDQSAKLLVGDEPFNYLLGDIGVFVVEDHRIPQKFGKRS